MPRRSPRAVPARSLSSRARRFTPALWAAILSGACLAPGAASAQQIGYTADRILLGTNPDDGFATWRPVMSEKTRFFGSFTADYIRRPLRLSSITGPHDGRAIQAASSAVISDQINTFYSVGTEVFGRFGFALTMPVTVYNHANDPSNVGVTTGVDVSPAAPGDLRLDARALAYTSDSQAFRLGFSGSFFVPSGRDISFAGDGNGHTLLQALIEEKAGPLILTQNVGVHFRARHDVQDLRFQNEGVFSAGIFVPLRDDRVRVGVQIHGSTGLGSLPPGDPRNTGEDNKTTFTRRNTPVEWLGEARVALLNSGRLWVRGGAGTVIIAGYSAPDVRVIGQIGYFFGLEDPDARSPARKFIADTDRVAEKEPDQDGDGIPDAIDACPTVPGVPSTDLSKNGCPPVKDRDGDGIPDSEDACPDVAGVADPDPKKNGCPDTDYDKDGIPNVKDACPNEPGEPSPDPKKNGCPQFIRRVQGSNEIQVLKKIEFDTGKASIKAGSYPILEEVIKLLKVNTNIAKLNIEGHTDDRGAHEMNMKLSQDRAASVLQYLVDHGIAATRLSSAGYGPDKPLGPNTTDAGRQKNRRVEFHIVE